MTSSPQHALNVHYDGTNWQAIDNNHNMLTLSIADGDMLPSLPDHAMVSSLLLPIEYLLSRSFSLPFSNPKFIDQDILAQQLEEHTSENSQAWWLAWQAGKTDDGVAGIMLGLPEDLRQQMDAQQAWQHTKSIGTDISLRLNAQREKQFKAYPELGQITEPIAVFDADSSGLFFALWQPASHHGDGFWQAMRRINWHASPPSSSSNCSENIQHTLRSMGWNDSYSAIGLLPTTLHSALDLPIWHGDCLDIEALPSRHEANIAITTASSFNFRHGRWHAVSHLGELKPWYRSMALILSLMLIWSAGMVWQNHQLKQQIKQHQQHVITAFHTGLPHETVIIDALAQLRKAAGGNHASSGNTHQSSRQWLEYLQAINHVYQQNPWHMKALSFQHGKMNLTGQCDNLQTMNRIHHALQQAIGQQVKLQDTDLSDHHVTFTLVWS